MRSNLTVVWGQVNNTWRDTIEVAFAAANCLVLLVTLHAGLLANLFVAWAVHHQKSLQTSNNALLVNLAVIDILRCAVDCPFLLSIVLSARDLGLIFCSAQIASFSLICCVQLLTLACISAERYQAIAHPFKSAERRKRIALWILLTWLAPISISVVCVVFAKDSPVYVRCRGLREETFESYDTFGLYILTPVWCVCLTVIVGFYGRIFLLVRAHGRKIFDKGSLPPPEKKKEDKKPKQEETKNSIKNYTENPQTIDNNCLKPNQQEPSGENKTLDLHPTSEELPTTVTDIIDEHEPEIVAEKSMNDPPNETPPVLEGVLEPNNHQDSSPSANEEVDSVESSTYQVTHGEVFGGSTNGEGGKEDPIDRRDMTSETSPSANEDGETSPTNQEGEKSPINEDGETSLSTNEDGETSPSTNEDGETSPLTNEDGETSPINEDGETSPSTNEDGETSPSTNELRETSPINEDGETSPTKEDDTVESSAPQDTTETSPTTGIREEGAGETTAAPQEEEEEVAGAVCMMPSLAQRERGNAKKESKLAKRSGYIIFTFLIFWIPLIATVLLNHFYYKDGNLTVEVFQGLEILTVSLVCMTSLTNPIIYAAVNPQFRTEFHNLKTKWKAFFTRS